MQSALMHLKNLFTQCHEKVFLAVLVAVAATALQPRAASAQPAVPPEFQDLYTSLTTDLDAFNATLNANGTPAPYPVLRTGALTAANSNSGSQIDASGNYPTIQLQLQALKAMGVQAVLVEVGFPMLYQPFLQDKYANFVTFYATVAASVRAAGLKLVVENNCMLNGNVESGWNVAPFYASLTWDQYQQARAQTAVVIAQTMQPDYMGVIEEPDTEAMMSGQAEANTVDGSVAMLNQILSAVQQAGITGTKFGAGVGLWMPGFDQYVQAYAGTSVDFIDFHSYPVNNNFLNNALTIASIASAAGKPVAMTESWLWKVRDSELNVLVADQIMARDPYSFWAPLDTYFIQTMGNLANYTKMLFQTPTGSQYYWQYQDYNSIANLPPSTVWSQEMQLMAQANQTATYSSTGMSYYGALVSPADTTAPSMPANVTGVSGSPTGTYVSWTSATDDVGVAGYYVFRNGVNIATTANAYFQDTGLTPATTYAYAIQAFDLGGNVSPQTMAVNVMTQDLTPPSGTTILSATSSNTSQITITWAPATDNVAIGSYRVWQGTSANTLTQIQTTAGTTTSFTNYSLTPGTQYFYSVQAVDTSGNVGPMCPVVSATTLALPSAPSGLSATANSTSQVSLVWTPGPSGMAIASYRILRGTTSANLAQVAVRSTPSYTDTGLTATTTYYYAVQEVDSGGNVSPPSLTISVITLGPPQPPVNVVATAKSTKQVGVTWSAGTSSLTVKNYRVFRGSDAASLAQVAIVTAMAYTDNTVSAATTYCYGIEEMDSSGTVSSMSATGCVTTPALPSPPIGLTATSPSTKQVALSWSPGPSGMPVASYKIYRGATSTGLTQLGSTTKTTYTDASVTAGTQYYYAVAEVDTVNNISDQSTVVPVTVLALPSPPIGLTATAASIKQINLSWAAGPSGMPISSYKIFRGSSPDSLTVLVTTKNTTFSDKNLTASTTYYYAVEEVDSGGNVSPLCGPVWATTIALPQAPTGVSGAATANKQITVSWTPGPSGLSIAAFRMFRGATASSLTQVAQSAGSPYVDKSVAVGTTYYYGVEEVDSAGNVSPMSAIVLVSSWGPPSAPVNVSATAVSPEEIDLAWTAGPSNLAVASYKLFRGTSPSNLAQIATTAVGSYNNKGLIAGTTYYYAVEEVDSAGNVSPLSAVVQATTLPPPSAPANVAATVVSTKEIDLAWTPGPSSLPIASYKILRGTSPAALTQIASVSAAAYADKSLAASTTYYYAITEVDSAGNVSIMSSVVSGTTSALPSAPVNLIATANSTKQVVLTWAAGTAGMPIASYRVYQGATAASMTQVGTTTGLTYTVNNLIPATTYYFAIAEVDSAGNVSPLSTAATATTYNLPSPPADVTATAVSKTQIIVSWTPVQSGMTLSSFKIFRGSDPTSLTQLKTAGATQTSITDYPVTAGTTYYYAVQAVDASGNVSAMSTVTQATTPN